MRPVPVTAIAAVITVFVHAGLVAQAPQPETRAVAGGGISVPGWTGKVDPGEEKAGQVLANAKLAGDAKVLLRRGFLRGRDLGPRAVATRRQRVPATM